MTERILTAQTTSPERLDHYIARVCSDLSRSGAQTLIKRGLVRVNAHSARASMKVRDGDHVVIEDAPLEPPVAAEDVPFRVVYEDAQILVVDKPAGVVVHPACGHSSGTLLNGIMRHWGTQSVPVERAGLVHRLDKDTSGLLVIAKTDTAFRSLAGQFAHRTVRKTYTAVVSGVVGPDEGVIDKPLGRSSENRMRIAVVSGGRASETRFRVRTRLAAATVLDVWPRTGRTHQIRVHLASIGHPIVGDQTYGTDVQPGMRMMLHARRLEIAHPKTRAQVAFASPLPKDFREQIDRLRSDR